MSFYSNRLRIAQFTNLLILNLERLHKESLVLALEIIPKSRADPFDRFQGSWGISKYTFFLD